MAVSKAEFGRRVGYHFSMASRILTGNRLPSVDKIAKIHKVYGIPMDELVDAHQKGAAHFGPWLWGRVQSIDAQIEAAAKTTGTVEAKQNAGK